MGNNDTLEVIQRIPLDKLRPYPDHPFGVRDDDMMRQTVESIKQFGVLVPGIARPLPDGTFELIAGHRRKQATPSFSQAQRMRRLSGEGKLNDDTILGIMLEQKKPENWNLTLPMEKIRKYFPRSYTPQRMEETILKLLESWMRQQKRQRDQQR